MFNSLLIFFFIFFPIWFLAREKGIRLRGKADFGEISKSLGLFSSGLKSDAKKAALLFIGLFVVAVAVTGIFVFFGIDDSGNVVEVISQVNPLMLAYVLTVGVTAEEVFFRGFLVPKAGIFQSSALFALMHVFYGSIVEVVGAFFLGALLAWAFKRNKTLLPNIFAHVGYNLAALALLA